MKYEATERVLTPNGPMPCCAKHAAQIKAILGIVGVPSMKWSVEEGTQCLNCMNEHKLETSHD